MTRFPATSWPTPERAATQAQGFDLAAAIAPELKPIALPPERWLNLQGGLMERVRQSALAHRDFTTVRREDGGWADSGAGLQRRALSALGGVRVDLLRLAADEPLPWADDAVAQEILVLEGSLALPGLGAEALLSRLQHIVLGRGAATPANAGGAGAVLYVRSRVVGLERLPEAEARWWRAAEATLADSATQDREWSAFVVGVEAAVLIAHEDVASMLVRLAPGALVPNHGHPLNEDCFMLEGDMYLGDILLRPGDYQLALVGAHHVGIASDEGGLFYFHGTVPEAAGE